MKELKVTFIMELKPGNDFADLDLEMDCKLSGKFSDVELAAIITLGQQEFSQMLIDRIKEARENPSKKTT